MRAALVHPEDPMHPITYDRIQAQQSRTFNRLCVVGLVVLAGLWWFV